MIAEQCLSGVWMRPRGDAERARVELFSRIRRGQTQLIETLIEQYKTPLYRFLVHLVGDRALADDLFQETWLRVVEHFGRYDPRQSFEAWMFAIARHAAIDHLRRKTVRSEVALENNSSDEPMSVLDRAEFGEKTSVLDCLVAAETRTRVRTLLAGLPWHYREVLLLRFQQELPLEEIARILGLPLSTVKTRVKRGLDALRLRLEALGEGRL